MSWWIPHCCNQEAAHDPMSFFPSTILDAQCQAGIWIFSMPWLLRTKVSAWLWSCLSKLDVNCDGTLCLTPAVSTTWICLDSLKFVLSRSSLLTWWFAWIFLPLWTMVSQPLTVYNSLLMVPIEARPPIQMVSALIDDLLLKLDVNYAWTLKAELAGSMLWTLVRRKIGYAQDILDWDDLLKLLSMMLEQSVLLELWCFEGPHGGRWMDLIDNRCCCWCVLLKLDVNDVRICAAGVVMLRMDSSEMVSALSLMVFYFS